MHTALIAISLATTVLAATPAAAWEPDGAAQAAMRADGYGPRSRLSRMASA